MKLNYCFIRIKKEISSWFFLTLWFYFSIFFVCFGLLKWVIGLVVGYLLTYSCGVSDNYAIFFAYGVVVLHILFYNLERENYLWEQLNYGGDLLPYAETNILCDQFGITRRNAVPLLHEVKREIAKRFTFAIPYFSALVQMIFLIFFFLLGSYLCRKRIFFSFFVGREWGQGREGGRSGWWFT